MRMCGGAALRPRGWCTASGTDASSEHDRARAQRRTTTGIAETPDYLSELPGHRSPLVVRAQSSRWRQTREFALKPDAFEQVQTHGTAHLPEAFVSCST